MRSCRILFVGGGSSQWIPYIGRDFMQIKSLQNAELVLYDINKKASDLNKKYLDKLAGKLKLSCRVTSTDNPATAFKDANYIVITISTGGFKSMAYDLSIPEEYSIFHTVGDTLGPAGWARSIRNYDTFVDLANKINKYCPNAFVLNYTNPMPFLTDILQRSCKGPVVGLCHGLFENIRVFKELYRAKDKSDIHLKYAGLNHFFWITEARYKKIDIVADFKKRLKTKTISDLLPVSKADPMGFKSGRAVADELFRITGVIPYFGDRHTCEFFSCFITNKNNMCKYKIRRTSIEQRIKVFKEENSCLKKSVKGELPEDCFEKSEETVADIIDAHLTGKSFIDVGNVKNIGQISNLPLGTVVETACVIDSNGVSPISFGPLPETIAGFCGRCARVIDMTVKACLEKDKDMALQALRLDPVCAHLNWGQVKEMGEKLLKAHKKYISIF